MDCLSQLNVRTASSNGMLCKGKRGQTTFRAPTLWCTGVCGAKCRLSPFSLDRVFIGVGLELSKNLFGSGYAGFRSNVMFELKKYIIVSTLMVAAGALSVVTAQQRPAVFTAEQASAGRAAYTANCASCHLPD